MAISAHILKIVENDPFLRLQMTAKEIFNRHQFSNLPNYQIYRQLTENFPKNKYRKTLENDFGLIS